MRDMGSSANSAEKFPLHQAVFNYDKREIKRLLESNNIRDIIDCQDVHGNTALLLAVMLGYCDVVADLLAKGADIRIESNDGWNALVEAISYGNRKMISCILAEQNHRSRLMLVTRKPHFIKLLSGLNDFYMELKWDFETWIPLLSNLLPSDTCKIYKRGTQLRVDTSLVDFHDLIWQRGDISLLFSPQNATQSIVIMDNKKRIFQDGQKLWKVVGSRSHEKEVDEIMSQDIVSVECSTKTIGFTRAMSGWLFRQEKKVCFTWPCRFYVNY